MNSVNGSVKIIDDQLDDGLIIVRTEEDRFIAFSIYCTHRQAEVEFDIHQNLFECSSFGKSRFGLDGENISGRANQPLTRYQTEVKVDHLMVTI